jgi:hypothetical protein
MPGAEERGRELADRHVSDHPAAERTDGVSVAVEQIDAQRRNRIGGEAIVGPHVAILAGCRCQFHGNNSAGG